MMDTYCTGGGTETIYERLREKERRIQETRAFIR